MIHLYSDNRNSDAFLRSTSTLEGISLPIVPKCNISSTLPLKVKQYKSEICGKTLAQFIQGSDGCTISGNIQGQVGWGSEQPNIVKEVPAYCREVGLDHL